LPSLGTIQMAWPSDLTLETHRRLRCAECLVLALFGHGLNSEMGPLCEQQRTSAKATEFMGSRPGFLWLGRIVEHVLAEITLLLVGTIDCVAALGIAIPAAGDIFG
jgi:hypothetical protein